MIPIKHADKHVYSCTLAPLLFIIFLDYVLRTSIDLHSEKGFSLHTTRSRRYPAVKSTITDCADDLAIFSDTAIFSGENNLIRTL